MAERFYDKNTLYISEFGNATEEQIANAFQKELNSFQAFHPFHCEISVNIAYTRTEEKLGFAFVHFSNSIAYYLFNGKNIDGTNRELIEEDLSWKPPENLKPPPPPPAKPDDYDPKGMSWADMADLEDDFEEIQQRHKFAVEEYIRKTTRPKIITKLDPLVNPPVFEDHPFRIAGAIVVNPDAKMHPNIIRAYNVPPTIGFRTIKNEFIKFASDSTTKYSREHYGSFVTDSYPFIIIDRFTRNVFVVFDPSTRDAQFCLHMKTKCLIDKNLLIFKLAWKTEINMPVIKPYKNETVIYNKFRIDKNERK